MYTEIILTITAVLLLAIVGGLWHLRKNSDKTRSDTRTIGYILIMIDQSLKELLRQKGVENEVDLNDEVVQNKHQALSDLAKSYENKGDQPPAPTPTK